MQQKIISPHQSPITLTWKIDDSLLKRALSKSDYNLYIELYSEAQKNPKKHLERVRKLAERAPNTPEVQNLLAYTYLRLRKVKKAEKVIESNYLKNQDHIISKMNYADLLLRKKKHQKIKELFPILDLQALYPQRKDFHASEYRAFHTFIGFYQLFLKNKEKASHHYALAHRVDPSHPSLQALKKRLHAKTLIDRIKSLGRLVQKLRS